VDPDTVFLADEGYVLPQPEQIDPATFDASTVVSPQSAGFVAAAGEAAAQPTARRRSLQQADPGLPDFGNVDPAEAEVEDPTEVEEPELPEDEGPEDVVGPRPAGGQLMGRSCDGIASGHTPALYCHIRPCLCCSTSVHTVWKKDKSAPGPDLSLGCSALCI
jgi:hypothetical protein